MKKTLFTLLTIALCTAGFAQTDTTQKTLFKNAKVESAGMYFTAGTSFGQFYNTNAILTQFGFGGMINYRYRGSFEVESLVSNENLKTNALIQPFSRMRWRFSTVALQFDYTMFPKKVISLNPGLAIGMGMVNKHALDGAPFDTDAELDDSNMFMLRPSLSVNVNVVKFLAIKIGGGYRYMVGSNTQGIRDNQMSSPYGFVALRLEIGGKTDQ
jgi:hypothetical protein